MKFKIGDKVILKDFSEKCNEHGDSDEYYFWMRRMDRMIGKEFIITRINRENEAYNINDNRGWGYMEYWLETAAPKPILELPDELFEF